MKFEQSGLPQRMLGHPCKYKYYSIGVHRSKFNIVNFVTLHFPGGMESRESKQQDVLKDIKVDLENGRYMQHKLLL